MSTAPRGDFDALIGGILEGALAPVEAPTEAAWLATWESLELRHASPIATAVAGGARADWPAWVFLAGYQAGLQRCFPEAGAGGWSAYAVSEDREGTLPGVTVAAAGAGVRLTGTKTWLAACEHVPEIVVSVGFGPERRFYLVERGAPGVTIEARPAPGYLGELTQGRVTFDATPVEGSRIISEWSRAADFAVAEPLYVLTSLNACLLSQLRRLDAPSHLLGRPLAALLALRAVSAFELTSDRVTLALAGIEAETQAAAAEFSSLLAERAHSGMEPWAKDRRLFGMFEAGIRRRADALSAPA